MRWWITVALGLAVNGCAAAHPDEASITVDELCTRVTDALCAGRQSCCTTPDTNDRYPSDEECRMRVRDACDWGSAPQADREPFLPLDMAFDARAAQTLVARFEDAARNCTVPPLVMSVQGLLSPHLREGDPCVDDRECTAELWCIPDSVEPGAGRHCMPASQAAGEPCAAHAHCIEGFGCRIPEGASVGTCDKANLGEPCGYMPCVPDLLCKMDYDASSECVVPGTVGAPCTKLVDFGGCANGFYCAGDVISGEHCAALLDDGEACADGHGACRSRVCLGPWGDQGVDRRCVVCTDDNCDGTCIEGTCIAPAPPPVHLPTPRPRWPTSPIDFLADGAACARDDDCAGGSCDPDADCADPFACPRRCASLPAEPIWCQVGVPSRSQRW